MQRCILSPGLPLDTKMQSIGKHTFLTRDYRQLSERRTALFSSFFAIFISIRHITYKLKKEPQGELV